MWDIERAYLLYIHYGLWVIVIVLLSWEISALLCMGGCIWRWLNRVTR